ncbi:RNA-guided endonuclease InsQ/TnpB family protein [Baaleninema sp.]|uniref:RNA-guided endonuclease InsQ/TnpB family protein n=1 Tax=Baaleninema sp. TaxID=3101197 RepID=UPI003D06EAB4
MFVLESKLYGSSQQFTIIDEMIRTAGFVRNKCLRLWMDTPGTGQYDLSAYCKVLAKEFEWAGKLNSQARQASAERAWSAIKRFYDNCKKKIPGKKGYPRFKKSRSVEYKTSGWKLSEDRQSITFTDKFAAGTFPMRGAFDLNYYDVALIKRVRVVRRADGYYAQFCIHCDKIKTIEPSGKAIGLDVGLNHFYTDSDGQTVENPRLLRKSEKALKRLQRQVSRKKKGSKNRRKAVNRLGRKHLKVQRQRKDFAVKLARCVVTSNDVVAESPLTPLNKGGTKGGIRNLLKNHKLAKSISDASWRLFFEWLEYYGKVFGKIVVGISPEYTSQRCSACGETVKKTLSQRTHICSCGCVLDRDHNAALKILAKGLAVIGRGGQSRTAGLDSENASGEIDLCAISENLSSKLAR